VTHRASLFLAQTGFAHDIYRGQGTVVRSLRKQVAYAVIVFGSGHQVVEYDEIIHRRIKVRIVFQTVEDASHELYVGHF
jgi:hypothetical protein